MSAATEIVLSASRRTDIPAFYLKWFMAGINRGYFEVQNPYNHKMFEVPADPHRVHSIVFWSKNFGPFLSRRIGQQLNDRGYHLWFNFTINSANRLLEPKIPPLDHRLSQLSEMTRRFDPRTVVWRFDPICVYRTENGGVADNLSDFTKIARHAAACGVTECVTSFVDLYPKIKKRTSVVFSSPSQSRKIEMLSNLQNTLAPLGMALKTCCEREVVAALPADCGIQPGQCVAGRRLKDLFGGHPVLHKDAGQRLRQGCGCTVSKDVGSYRLHPCYHDCLFCYANPSCDGRRRPGVGPAAKM